MRCLGRSGFHTMTSLQDGEGARVGVHGHLGTQRQGEGGDDVAALTFDELLNGRGSIFRWEDLQVQGTELQVAVWREMFGLQPGELITYSQLAARCGYPRAVRAVASAVGKNPISLIIPCHRVVRSEAFVHRGGEFATKGNSAGKESGKINVSKLGNYYWGKELKIKILEWEELI